MSDYTKTTNFTAKDALSSGDPNKVIKGSYFDTEFDNISTAVASKADKTAPTTGTNVAILSAGGDIQDGGYRFTNLSGAVTTTTSDMNNVAPLASGTKMIFYQSAAPTGWTQDASVNDRVLRVISSGTVSSGGSWTISGISVDSHVLTVDEMPSHSHSIGYNSGDPGGPNTLISASGSSNVTGTTGGDQGHSHGLTVGSSWRPAYIDVIIATRD